MLMLKIFGNFAIPQSGKYLEMNADFETKKLFDIKVFLIFVYYILSVLINGGGSKITLI